MLVKLFEDFTEGVTDIRNTIFLEAVKTGDVDIVKSFIKRGYDVNGTDDITVQFIYDIDLFKLFLENKGDVKESMENHTFKRLMKDLKIQKLLIDFGYDGLIHDTIGFNRELSEDPKYSNVVDMHNDVGKFNI